MLVGLQVLLDMRDTVLDLMTVVDVQVSRELTGTLVHLDDGTEQIFYALSALKRCRNHWHTKQRTQRVEVNLVATAFKLVVHIQRAHHAYVHVHQLGGKIQVTLQVRRVDDVNHHIRHFLGQMLAYIQFLGRIARERVSARQVGEVKLVTEHRCMCLGGIHRYTAVVTHMAVGTRCIVEQRGLTTVRITHQRYVDGTALLHSLMTDIIILMAITVGSQIKGSSLEWGIGRHHLDVISLLVTQTHLVTHQLVLHGIL